MRYVLFVAMSWLVVLQMFIPSLHAGDNGKRVALLKTPGRGIQPQAIMDDGGVLHLIYFQGDPGHGDVFYVRRKPGEQRFSAPVRVNSEAGSAIAVGSIRGGQMALGKDGRVHVAWNGSGQAKAKGPGRGTPMLYTRLDDTGSTFEPERNLMHHSEFLDGGGSVTADKQGHVYVAWQAKPIDGPAGPEHRRVWIAVSHDDGKTFAPERRAFQRETGACPCCGLRAFTDRKGTNYLIYRAATDVLQRDMWLLASADKGKSFQGGLLDKWEIDTCPMSSQSFAEGPDGVYTAWDTKGQVYFARIKNSGPAIGDPISAPGTGGGRKHPALAVNSKGEVILVWTEGTGWQRGGALAWQVYDAKGQPTAEHGRVERAIPVWGLPAVVANASGGFTLIH